MQDHLKVTAKDEENVVTLYEKKSANGENYVDVAITKHDKKKKEEEKARCFCSSKQLKADCDQHVIQKILKVVAKEEKKSNRDNHVDAVVTKDAKKKKEGEEAI